MSDFLRKEMIDIEHFISDLLNFGSDWTVDKIEVNHQLKDVDIFWFSTKKWVCSPKLKVNFQFMILVLSGEFVI